MPTTIIRKHRFNVQDSQLYHERFYRMPQWLYTKPPYKNHLSNNDRVAYMMLRDRSDYSVRNQWFDQNGDIYFIFTNKELADLIGVTSRTIQTIKEKLVKVGLLEVEKQGFNQVTKQKLPDRLYLIQPTLTPTDTYLNHQPEKISARRKSTESSKKQQPEKISARGKSQSNADSSQPEKISVNQEEDNKDTYKILIDTHNKEQIFSSSNYSQKEIADQNQQLLKSAPDFFTKTDNKADMILNEEGLNWLSIWCRTPQQMKEVIGIILKAKHGVLDYIAEQVGKDKASDLDLYMAELATNNPEENRQIKYQLTLTLKKVLNSIRSGEEANKPVKNQTGYMYKAFYNFYAKYFDKLLQSNANAE